MANSLTFLNYGRKHYINDVDEKDQTHKTEAKPDISSENQRPMTISNEFEGVDTTWRGLIIRGRLAGMSASDKWIL